MVVLDTPYVYVDYQKEARTLSITWLKKPVTASFREVYLQALAFVGNHPDTTLYCTNLTHIGPLEREQENWLNQEYYPKVYGIIQDEIYAAIVFSDAHFKAIVSNYQLPAAFVQPDFINFNYFTSQHEAMTWLEDVKKGQDAAVLPPLS